MKTKEEILDQKTPKDNLPGYFYQDEIFEAMDEHAKQFAEWLAENTATVYEDKITLYRYRDQNNEWGNYTLEDIYKEYIRP